MQKLAAAFKYLTVWGRFSAVQPPAAMVGAGAIYFPVIGLLLGLLLAFLNYCLAVYLASEILSILLIAVLFAVTGAMHLEGTRNTFDALAPRMPPAPNGHTLGFVAIVFVILFKTGAVDVMDERLAVSLLLTPVAARWALVIFLYGYHDRCEEAPRLIAANVKFWHLLVATAATLGLAVYLLGRKGLWLALAVSTFALLARGFLHRRQAALTHDNFGAVVELSEVLSLILLASL